MYLKELCELDGVSGNEGAVRSFIKEKISPYCDEIFTDSIGNLIAKKNGKSSDKKVMVAAHTDEVGLIISGITEKGFLEFKTVGGIDTRVLISKQVRVGEDKIKGVIGMKAIHLQSRSERQTVPKVSSLFIDIGCKDKESAEEKVSLGDYASFCTEYSDFGSGKIKAKAIDDRVGCAIMLELVKTEPVYDTYYCFTAQEETGLRGAKIAASRISPDIALVIESTTCADVANVDEKDYVTALSKGAAISFADRRTIVERDFASWLYDEAKKCNIPVQYKNAVAGGNDAGAIHIAAGGVKTASVSVPARYIHSPVSIADKSDIDAVMQVAKMFVTRADELI